MGSGLSLNDDENSTSIFMPKQKSGPYVDKKGSVIYQDAELNNETMSGSLKGISGKYND